MEEKLDGDLLAPLSGINHVDFTRREYSSFVPRDALSERA
jgi:hypothetical protein